MIMGATLNQQLNDEVNKVLGFDPLKEEKGNEILDEVMQELQKERREETKKKVKDWTTEVVKLMKEQQNLTNQFNQTQKKAEEKIRGVLKNIKKFQSGDNSPPEEEVKSVVDGGASNEQLAS